ncbi:P-type conjugative transfer protein TrbJ [Sandaracinobacteroides saxicola]|nr:P-type conjugative transfer protein TrbJ [Sandaracinobacteroides saxicola]
MILVPLAPAGAIVVYDPTNYAQNVLQAARALNQINNQIRSLTNEAKSLLNEARNLTSLPYSSLAPLLRSVEHTRTLLADARELAYDVAEVDAAFRGRYAEARPTDPDALLVSNARDRWRTSLASLEDALKVQAGVVDNLATYRAEIEKLVNRSQGAIGALQASQSGNQLLALQAQQLADLTATMTALGRAQALAEAQRVAAQDQAREQNRRFLKPGSGYVPTTVTMFRN